MNEPIRDQRRKHWGWFDYDIVDEWGSVIGADGIAVYMVLARHADNDDRTSYPAVATIAHKTGLSERQVKRVLRQLAGYGLIGVQKQFTSDGRQTTNLYTLLPMPAAPVAGGEGATQSPRHDNLSPTGVTTSHGEGDCVAHKRDSLNETNKDVCAEPEVNSPTVAHTSSRIENDSRRAVAAEPEDHPVTIPVPVKPQPLIDATWAPDPAQQARWAAYAGDLAYQVRRFRAAKSGIAAHAAARLFDLWMQDADPAKEPKAAPAAAPAARLPQYFDPQTMDVGIRPPRPPKPPQGVPSRD